jgi:hypothetical protein
MFESQEIFSSDATNSLDNNNYEQIIIDNEDKFQYYEKDESK